MNERIKLLRNTLQMTQQEFADRIKVKRNTVATYEMGRSVPSDSAIALICKEFSVNETWLRTGTGDMFLQENKDAQISQMLDEVIKANESDFKRRLISALSKLDDDGWDSLEKLVENITATDKEK
ncbi:MAG: XRE family transcriptional regulator [Pseudobutyrivibrio sp.]|nr:XRE family transcriptional regulator [Pseudobutyrivibrio sp.]